MIEILIIITCTIITVLFFTACYFTDRYFPDFGEAGLVLVGGIGFIMLIIGLLDRTGFIFSLLARR